MQSTHLPVFTRGATRYFLLFSLLFSFLTGRSQTPRLTVEKIMQDPKWIGTSPSDPYWSQDGKYLFFSWNPDKTLSDSLYYITNEDRHPQKASYAFQQANISAGAISYNNTRTAFVYSKDGDIFEADVKTGKKTRITNTVDRESEPAFSFHDRKIVYTRNSNLFAWDIATGMTEQLTNFLRTAEPPKEEKKESLNSQEKWLRDDQLQQFDVL
ncbi:MAG: DPP IV N-terminal domain-containing protein, partial [Bacteroidota bacterium]